VNVDAAGAAADAAKQGTVTSGIININKPSGMTSFSVVRKIRYLTGIKKVGHAGTLDPMAEGVLPICLGSATRLVEHVVSARKSYRATIRLGAATDSFDSEGEVTAEGDPSGVTYEQVQTALQGFVGEIQQLPPMFSALKHKGQPLYRYARAGETVERTERTVSVYSLDLLDFETPLVQIDLEVGKGTYVRTIAHDLGEQLGCHGHLQSLTRTRSGPFTVENAVTLAQFEEAAASGNWEDHVYPADWVLESWHAALLGEQHTRDVRSGQLLVLSHARPEFDQLELDTPCRAYSTDGEFVAILRYRGAGRWHPARVFAPL
jgi:tRNA pseudouridine55 synthase